MRPRRALLGPSDKSGLLELARALHRAGVELIATGGTHQVLTGAGLAVTPVATVTGVPEFLGGRVKTLHPAIHGGILSRRGHPEDEAEMRALGLAPIDLVCVNLYPFAATVAAGADAAAVIEAIDIGGPTLLRAAAKNHAHVAALSHPRQYPLVIEALAEGGELPPSLLRQLAAAAFAHTAAYDAAVAAVLSAPGPPQAGADPAEAWPGDWAVGGPRISGLRYGENPHQAGALYRLGPVAGGVAAAAQVQGPPLSFTNWLDSDAAFGAVREWPEPLAAVVKHTTPCGMAAGADLAAAIRAARDCDPRSAYGGIVGVNRPLDAPAARALAESFLHAVVAPGVTPDALPILAERPGLRVLVVPPPGPEAAAAAALDVRAVDGGLLVQTADRGLDDPQTWTIASRRRPTEAEWVALQLAWFAVRPVRSNAIVLVRDGAAVGIGAGQMSRVEAVELAVQRAGDRARGSVLASDAFFPMPDGLEVAVRAGVTAAIHPGGSKADAAVLAAADAAGVALVLTGRRHFRH